MAKTKLLIIDDDLFWHRLLKRVFRGLEYDLFFAASCADGIKLEERCKPDCILLDFHLGDGDAVSVCSALRKNGRKFNSPVIVVSSDPDAEIPAYAECRAVCFLLKGARTVLDLPAIVGRTMSNNKMVRCGTETGMEPSF